MEYWEVDSLTWMSGYLTGRVGQLTRVLLLNSLFIAHRADQQQDLFNEETYSFKHICLCASLISYITLDKNSK